MQAQVLFRHPEVEDWEEGPWRELGWWGPGFRGEQAWIHVKVSAFRQGKGYCRREETGTADEMEPRGARVWVKVQVEEALAPFQVGRDE